MAISTLLRQQVRLRAKFLCEYCHSLEEVSAARFEIDHIKPRSLGGSDDLHNLALACQRCNANRYNFTQAIDPVTETQVDLFKPRCQRWSDHFMWSRNGQQIIGNTAIGRATISRLDLNDEFHNEGAIIQARAAWVKVGWHPPVDDPRQE